MTAAKVALITGGASGIGLATVERFAKVGIRVLVADLIVDDGPGTVRCDVSDPRQVEAAVAADVEQFGSLDIVVNNAGLPTPGLLGEFATEDFARIPVSLDGLLAAKQGRVGAPDDIARAIAYLASDEADFLSGAALPVDNAMSAGLF